ncbi:serine aminopeptidase domain-containing protein [Sphingomonas bacterium]|uniref:serine aminopeptidase domain-containing protein n=1 Tax=Sphingomonas bacterium TaxID=1895847 RepID=UPI0015767529|nr:alpha/beta hydrolase [Sphingomonas bacterium]
MIAIEVVGGPGGSISPGETDALAIRLAQQGITVVRIGYTGTRHRSIFPEPDFRPATHEIARYTGEVRRLNPHAKIVLVGESLGGLIAAQVMVDMQSDTVDELELVLPSFYSPTQALSNFKTKMGVSPSNDSLIATWQLYETSDLLKSGSYHMIQTLNFLGHFFAPEDRTISLATLFKRLTHVSTNIFFREADVRTGPQLASHLAQFKNINLVRLKGEEHNISGYDGRYIAGLIMRTIRDSKPDR